MLEYIKNILWGIPTVALITAFGLYFTVKSRFFQITGLKKVLSGALYDLKRGSEDGVSAAAALSTALGGTVGIGSIAGVGIAVAEGGPGSIFWMWVTGFLGCMLKYAEINVAVKNRTRSGGIFTGGAMYALEAEGRKFAAAFFAVMCILASCCTGCLTQSSAVTAALVPSGFSEITCGLFIGLAVLFSVAGGRRSIAKISELLVPVVSLIYILMTLYIIIARAPFVPSAFSAIFRSAFGFRQAGAGITGYTVSAAIKTGVTRGVFSSEAGMGSSPIVHSASENASPHSQGQWGIIEMIADTFVFSTITAVALIATGFDDVGLMYSTVFGVVGRAALPAQLAVFGFASIISWCFYAETCIRYLFVKSHKAVSVFYRAAVAVLSFFGAVAAAEMVWDLADILNALMILPNLYVLFIKRKEICSCFGRQKR